MCVNWDTLRINLSEWLSRGEIASLNGKNAQLMKEVLSKSRQYDGCMATAASSENEKLRKIAELNGELNTCISHKAALQEVAEACRDEKLELQDKLDAINQGKSEEAAMNTDYPMVERHYEKRYILDEYAKKVYLKMWPQEYIYSTAYLLNEAKTRIFNKYHPTTEEEVVKACWCWIGADSSAGGLGARYRPDDYFGTIWNDFWQFPEETIAMMKGDCEDLAILWKCLCDQCGVPKYKTRVHIGMYGTNGHAYGVYKPGPDKQELLIEATERYPSYSSPLTTLASHPEYISYFAFNGEHLWQVKAGMEFGSLVDKIGETVESIKKEMMRMKLPEWMKLVAMHGVSGFLIGFSAAFVAGGKPEIPELQTAIYTACVGGLYGALKAVAAYLETMLKPTVPAAQLKRPMVAGQEPTTWTKNLI